MLERRGWEIIDVDALGHEALSLRKSEVAGCFGAEVIGEDGRIDRRRLGAIVFDDGEKLRALEAIVHPEMRRMVRHRVEELRDERDVCINAALLFPMQLHGLCEAVIKVTAPLPLRLIRARRRDSAPIGFLLKRFAGQRSLFPKHHGNDVDMYTVRNCTSRARLEKKIERTVDEAGRR